MNKKELEMRMAVLEKENKALKLELAKTKAKPKTAKVYKQHHYEVD